MLVTVRGLRVKYYFSRFPLQLDQLFQVDAAVLLFCNSFFVNVSLGL